MNTLLNSISDVYLVIAGINFLDIKKKIAINNLKNEV